MDNVSEEDQKKQIEFVMRVGYQMQNYLNRCLVENFKTHEERSAAFFSTLINFIANVMADVSPPDRLAGNIKEIIDGLQDWLAGKDVKVYGLDKKTNKIINKKDLH